VFMGGEPWGECAIPQGNRSDNDLGDNCVEILVFYGMQIVDVACDPGN